MTQSAGKVPYATLFIVCICYYIQGQGIKSNLDVVVPIIEKGGCAETLVDANKRNQWGQGPLHRIALPGDGQSYTPVSPEQLEQVDQLLSRGADLEQSNLLGQTPLLLASQKLRANLVGHLLSAGANSEVRDGKGRTPLQIAVDSYHTGPAFDTYSTLLREQAACDTAKILIARGALLLTRAECVKSTPLIEILKHIEQKRFEAAKRWLYITGLPTDLVRLICENHLSVPENTDWVHSA